MAAYDVFISFRNTDDNGCPTQDAVMAESLYHALRAKGYNPFFSKYSIDANGRADYVTLINNALETAKVLVAVATSRANVSSRWVKREINMFSALMMREPEGARVLVTYRSADFPVDELPVNLADLQSFPDEKAVVRFIDVALRDADGFRNDGFSTEVLYAPDAPYGEITNPLIQGLQSGDVLDNRYTILQMIGRGGTSNVFLAVDGRTNRQVAVKEIRASDHMDPSVVMESVRQEIDLLKTLRHPSLVELLDVISFGDSLAIIMEYVSGASLQKLLSERGPQTEAFTITIARQVAEALDYLHTLPFPVIYRDLKPANILLQSDQRIKLIDFGTARRYNANNNADTTCLGTIGYAAPEQYGGMGQTDARTDIYCLGVTLYHMVTGKNPAEPPYEILPIRQVNPNLSQGLEYFIQKCTQKDPKNRFQSAGELLNALDNLHRLGKFPLFQRKRRPKPVPKKPLPLPKPSTSQASQFHIPGTPVIPPPNTPPVIPLTPPAAPPVVPVPGFHRSGAIPQTGALSGSLPGITVPLTPAVPSGTTEILGYQKPAGAAPEQDDLLAKFSALDPEAQQIVRQLIDKLSQ